MNQLAIWFDGESDSVATTPAEPSDFTCTARTNVDPARIVNSPEIDLPFDATHCICIACSKIVLLQDSYHLYRGWACRDCALLPLLPDPVD